MVDKVHRCLIASSSASAVDSADVYSDSECESNVGDELFSTPVSSAPSVAFDREEVRQPHPAGEFPSSYCLFSLSVANIANIDFVVVVVVVVVAAAAAAAAAAVAAVTQCQT